MNSSKSTWYKFFLNYYFPFFTYCFLWLSAYGNSNECKKQSFSYKGHDFTFYDNQHSNTIDCVTSEIHEQTYPLSSYTFEPGDVVIDIGAHVGIISITLAKLHPEITIYAFEACKGNFENLQKNIEINQASNVHAFNLAVTGKSGEFVDVYDLSIIENNSGGSSLLVHNFYNENKEKIKKNLVTTISLDDIFANLQIQKCKLLKIDCEGSEYAVLLSSQKFKEGVVENLVGEFHLNNFLASQGHSREMLADYCRQHVQSKVQLVFMSLKD